MSTDDVDPLLRVTGAISDGEQVDWEREAADSKDLAELEDELRALEGLARARAIQTQPEPGEPIEGTWGEFRLLEELGRGSFGEVFRAYDPSLEREVALKILRPERASGGAGSRFLTEARRLARVRHPHVVTVHGADVREGRIGLWMELLHGRTVEETLSVLGLFSPLEAIAVGMQLCRALAAIHSTGLVHLDVKASNVMRERGGRIVLMDFGAVREFRPGAAEDRVTLGTPIVMAPEQLRGEPVGPASDLYALGALLYRLATGRYPLEATSVTELADLHARGAGTPLRDLRPDLPGEFVRLVGRALNPRPQQRFASAGAMEGALAAAAGALTRTELGLPTGSANSGTSRVPLRVAAAATLFLAGFLAGFLFSRLPR